MAITLDADGSTVTLPADLQWLDDASWHPVEQSVQRTVTGALVVSTAARLAGRPITLAPADDQSAWITRATLDQLIGWAATPGQQMALTLRSVVRTVVWRHQDGAIDAAPVARFADVQSGDYYLATLRFMEV